MLSRMRDETGEPSVRFRLVALVLAVLLLLGAAPLLVPLLGWLWNLIV